MNEDARLADMKHQLDEVLAMHARIIAGAPVNVEAAYATILRIGAGLAREGRLTGKELADAVDKIKRYLAQEQAANDTMAARVTELDAKLEQADEEKFEAVSDAIDACHRLL